MAFQAMAVSRLFEVGRYVQSYGALYDIAAGNRSVVTAKDSPL